MITFDASELLVLLLAAALMGAVLVVLPPWRRLMGEGPTLPIHKHAHAGVPFDAEIRCAFCAGRQECRRRGTPLADCPNLELLQKSKAL
jgi:hypothetical protein